MNFHISPPKFILHRNYTFIFTKMQLFYRNK
nr:MAG TPA: hypothetical protein [Bacteriophage sp.]